jgi:formylglycine-generating enzyme required for sulfatase activity
MAKKHIALIFLTFILAACSSPLPQAEGSGEILQSGMGTTTSTPPTQTKPATVSAAIPTLTALPPASAPPTEIPTKVAFTVRTSPLDGMPQVYVPAGTVRMGGLDVNADDRDELPAHDVSLDAFWIDQLEVTNAMYMLCVQAGACPPPGDWASDKRPAYFNNEEFKDYPVVHVTWEQAGTYCAWADRRLPTEAEWERAARGDDFRNYPWGDEPPSEMYANFNRLVGETSRVGTYAAGASPFGALDMAGNVWEWVFDLYRIEYYSMSPDNNPAGPETNTTNLRVIRGGSFQDEWVDLRVSKRGAALGPDPDAVFDAPDRTGEHSSKIGFRCVEDE